MAYFKDVKVGDYYRQTRMTDEFEGIVTKVTPSHVVLFIIWHGDAFTPANICAGHPYSKHEWNRATGFPTDFTSRPALNDKKRIIRKAFTYPSKRE